MNLAFAFCEYYEILNRFKYFLKISMNIQIYNIYIYCEYYIQNISKKNYLFLEKLSILMNITFGTQYICCIYINI